MASPVSPLGPSFDSEKAGDREVQRTMLELLNQLDGFQPNTQVRCLRPLLSPLTKSSPFPLSWSFSSF